MVHPRTEGRRLTALELRVLPRIKEIPRASWDALLREGSSPFVEHTWLDCLEEAKCVGEAAGWIPRHLALYDGDELVAAAPAYAKTNSEGEFVFDWSWADLAGRMGIDYYPKLVLAVPFTPATGDRVLVHPKRDRGEMVAIFAQGVRQLVKELELSSAHVLFPQEDEAKAWGEAGFSMRHGVQYHWSNRQPEPFKDYEDFLASLPQKKRTQIRRERKQPAMDGVEIATLRPEEYTPAMAEAMYALYTTTVDKYFHGRRYMKKRFFELLTERFASRLSWVVARKQGDVIAGAFNIEKDGVIYGRYWGAHVDMPFLHFNVCYYHGVEQAIADGCKTFNPGAGGEHKKVRGFIPTITYSAHHIESPRFRAIVDSFLERERRGVDQYVAEERAALAK
ncbi:MAG TPA: GNAT family N-acetyltransferase [Labilithrix sp.]|nr:GNAT family N-acetyltransferase [Labilithrix sp.]